MKLIPDQDTLLQTLQNIYGSADYNQWQGIRKQFKSFITYPLAGASTLNFFGDSVSGTVNRQLTNMPKANSFGQLFFLLKQIRTKLYLADYEIEDGLLTDVSIVGADKYLGFANAGVLELEIGGKIYVQVPKPFQYCPGPGLFTDGTDMLNAMVLTTDTPDTYLTGSSLLTMCEIQDSKENGYLVDPNIFFEPEQSFTCSIEYPSGLLPVISTSVIATSNVLYVGVEFDGIVFRPLQ